MRAKDYSIQEVFNNTSLGFIFEFYSSKKTTFTAEDLTKALGKAVNINVSSSAIAVENVGSGNENILKDINKKLDELKK